MYSVRYRCTNCGHEGWRTYPKGVTAPTCVNCLNCGCYTAWKVAAVRDPCPEPRTPRPEKPYWPREPWEPWRPFPRRVEPIRYCVTGTATAPDRSPR